MAMKEEQEKFMQIFDGLLADKSTTEKVLGLMSGERKGDEVDLVNQEKEEALSLRLDQRNLLFLKKVEAAKQKILEGTYGECEDCGSQISKKRLMARPTASLCIYCQEEKERAEFGNFSKRRDLTQKKFNVERESAQLREKIKFNNISEIGFESVVEV